ncbi:autotransporter family protein [Roseibium aggregatum]|uniref:Autotransporter domain-containing protein n=1 Tax=Roseibium aggregatum TaxID=187304 RepID=A0A0M6YD32_9HYPH|nr:autotransporter outer membrane beta-barrel domain-containing protein [Roseibium aggregatum]CTQ47588.1 hypothetical protein LAL4801_06050 [Roseibium aggregatum]
MIRLPLLTKGKRASVILPSLMLVISVSLVSWSGARPAHAQCADVGGVVTCGSDVSNGFLTTSNITSFTINNGVTVDDSDTGNGANGGGLGVIYAPKSFTIGSFLNNGTITATGSVNAIYLDGDGTSATITESFINNGTINGDIFVFNFGGDDIRTGGIFVNNGEIVGRLDSLETFYGIFNTGKISDGVDINVIGGGSNNIGINNSGIISGIGIISDKIFGDIVNSGEIIGTTSGISSGRIFGKIFNSGTIRGGDYGVLVAETLSSVIYGPIDGQLINHGTIIGGIDGIRTENSDFYYGGYQGGFTNTGTIVGMTGSGAVTHNITQGGFFTNSGSISGGKNGVDIGNITDGGGLTNSGTIIGETGFGITVLDIDNNFLNTNTGVISGSTLGATIGNVNGSFLNEGKILAGTDALTIGNITGKFSNSGTISGANNAVNAAGSTIHGGFENSGLIEGKSGDGLVAASVSGKLVNSGTIIGGDHAIRLTGSDDTELMLLKGSVIQGAIDLGGGSNTFSVAHGMSTVTTFSGATPTIGTTSGAPYAVSGSKIAVVDPTSLSVTDEFITDLTGGIFSSLENRLSGVRNGDYGAVSTHGEPDRSGLAEPDHLFWADGFGTFRRQDSNGAATATNQWLGGFVLGADGLLHPDTRAGFFAGASWGRMEAESNAQDTGNQSFYVGTYASVLKAGLAFDLALTAGYSHFDQDRKVANNLAAGGIETATADYGGWFISPELVVTKPLNMSGAVPLELSAGARYAGLFLDAYTESGTSDPLTVNQRDVHTGIARLQLSLPHEYFGPNGGVTHTRLKAGIEGRTNFGGDTIDGALLGQNIAFDPGGEANVLGAFAGVSAEYDTAHGLVMYGDAESQVETSGSVQVSGRIGLKFKF